MPLCGLVRRGTCGTAETDRLWCNWSDGCGVVCAVITWLLLLFAEYALVFKVLVPWKGPMAAGTLLHGAIFTGLVSLAITSHVKAMMTNPGAVPSNAIPVGYSSERPEPYRMCRKCNAFKPPRAHHCSVCDRCIIKMDHHCPWVNNCVALCNHKFFLLFCLYVWTCSVYALVLIVSKFMQCSKRKSVCYSNETSVAVLFLTIEAILFGLFTMCMVCDQWSVVLTATTSIDRLKGEKTEKHSMWDNLQEVFGGEPGFSFSWLIPTSVNYQDPEAIFGYRLREEEDLTSISVVGAKKVTSRIVMYADESPGAPTNSNGAGSPAGGASASPGDVGVEMSDRAPPTGAKVRGSRGGDPKYHTLSTSEPKEGDVEFGP